MSQYTKVRKPCTYENCQRTTKNTSNLCSRHDPIKSENNRIKTRQNYQNKLRYQTTKRGKLEKYIQDLEKEFKMILQQYEDVSNVLV